MIRSSRTRSRKHFSHQLQIQRVSEADEREKKSCLIMGVKSHLRIKIGHVYSRRLESVGVCQKEKEGENGGQPRPVGSMLLDPAYT